MNRRLIICACLTFAGGALGAAAAAATPPAGPTGYRVLERVAGPDGGWDYPSVDARNGRVLVARGGAVMAVALADGKVTPQFATAIGAHAAMAVGGGSEVLITNGRANTVTFVDARSGALLATIPTGKNPDAAAVDAASGLVLVMDHGGGDVVLVDVKAHKAVASIPVGGELEAAVTDGMGRAYVNVEDKSEIAVIDLKGRKVLKRYALSGCDGPTGLAYDKAQGLLIAACDGAVGIVRASDGKMLQSLKIGPGADGVAYDAQRGLAFVPSGGDGMLTVLTLKNGRAAIVDTVATQRGARTIALDERTGRLYLPAAQYGPTPAGGGRPQMLPGTFQLLVVGK